MCGLRVRLWVRLSNRIFLTPLGNTRQFTTSQQDFAAHLEVGCSQHARTRRRAQSGTLPDTHANAHRRLNTVSCVHTTDMTMPHVGASRCSRYSSDPILRHGALTRPPARSVLCRFPFHQASITPLYPLNTARRAGPFYKPRGLYLPVSPS